MADDIVPVDAVVPAEDSDDVFAVDEIAVLEEEPLEAEDAVNESVEDALEDGDSVDPDEDALEDGDPVDPDEDAL